MWKTVPDPIPDFFFKIVLVHRAVPEKIREFSHHSVRGADQDWRGSELILIPISRRQLKIWRIILSVKCHPTDTYMGRQRAHLLNQPWIYLKFINKKVFSFENYTQLYCAHYSDKHSAKYSQDRLIICREILWLIDYFHWS